MKLLLDSCVWGGLKDQLKAAGHDVVWSGDWDKDPGDEEILRVAFNQQRTLITIDKDFGELAVVKGADHCGVLRLIDLSTKVLSKVCIQVLQQYGGELQVGAIVTAELFRVRIRPRA